MLGNYRFAKTLTIVIFVLFLQDAAEESGTLLGINASTLNGAVSDLAYSLTNKTLPVADADLEAQCALNASESEIKVVVILLNGISFILLKTEKKIFRQFSSL